MFFVNFFWENLKTCVFLGKKVLRLPKQGCSR
jgi:hypothetical protein